MALMMASLPLQMLCQLIAPNVTANCNNNHGSPVNQLQRQPSAILPEGYVEYPGQGVAYKFHTQEKVSWIKARELCVSEGAHLAVIDTEEKVQYVMESHPDGIFQVGLYSAYDEDQDWVSVTGGGAPILNLPWISGEPDSTYRCAVLKKGGLSNYSCSGNREYFICERSISSSIPAEAQTTVGIVNIS